MVYNLIRINFGVSNGWFVLPFSAKCYIYDGRILVATLIPTLGNLGFKTCNVLFYV
jgi:hypothetical protein